MRPAAPVRVQGTSCGPCDRTWWSWEPRPWDPEVDECPQRGISMSNLFAKLQKRRSKKAAKVQITKEGEFSPDHPEIRIVWAENWAQRSSEVSMSRVQGTEKIVREECARLGFYFAIIRAGVHSETNQYAPNGTVLTYYNEKTGRTENLMAKDDPHITVYFGHDEHNIIVQGHIYIKWDTKASFDMRIVQDCRDRTIVQPGRKACASEYWLVY
ncbi:hypothetical protein B0T20DRAFT_451536 [Sordaria brevicollis]|uniref:Uncharacterized protein n=1 Tax=Sordaria brevicollis TaxID=83679 RepID=A0AAE0UEH1_SORBR|nr:hypothetical protein B0T20DRAFT_451536 [Sordaria brevicollis]